MNQKSRSLTIDATKGMAILLVMVGHVLVWNHMEDGIIYDVIKVIQMPLFILVSGYLCGMGRKISSLSEYGNKLKKRALSYLTPFFFWIVLQHPLHPVTNIVETLFGLDKGLWFLMTLFLLTLMVNARHLFYGISMLEKYKGMGWKKPYLIFGMCDETFSINCTVTPPEGVDRGWFMFFVTLLNQTYWVAGATLGALLGSVLHFDTTGIEFVMTALFTVMFVNQWEEAKDHRPALTGLGCAALCLAVFGSDGFMLPAMALIIVCFLVSSKSQKKEEPAL